MSGIPYVGRAPDSDSSLTHKQYVDTRYGQIAVDLDYVNSAAAIVAASLVTQSYVDTQDNTRAKKSAVDAADANYVPLTARGVANGVATIGSDGYIPSSQLPTGLTDRVPVFVDATTILLTSHTCVATTDKEYLAATIEIADPGFAYHPLVLGTVSGSADASQSQIRRANSGARGKMLVLDSSNRVYAAGITNGTSQVAEYQIMPTCDPATTPSTVLPTVGALTLTLFLSCFSGSGYTFTNDNFSFYAICAPGV